LKRSHSTLKSKYDQNVSSLPKVDDSARRGWLHHMRASDIRQSFLRFFEERGHRIVASTPVIPWEDPTLLFANAGMNQFKDVFLGTGKRDYTRAADTQKCIRVSGKHNDLEEVGKDTYHHTFFEMLGNWSFGDYYKKEAIQWAWELLTEVWKLPKHRLWATIFETDEEAQECWRSETDIDHTHILRFGAKDNFWEMGETGPCGPCSEIHIDLTQRGDVTADLVNAGTGDLMEIWNLVFIQYDRNESGTLNPLPAKHVDTGMGLERIVAVIQGKKSNFDTDLFQPIIQTVEELTGKQYTQGNSKSEFDIAIRVIADHIRALTFAIADGAVPSNEGRGYVLRRILRRAARFGRNLGMHEPFMYKLVNSVVETMGEPFPELRDKQAHVERVVRAEEESFNHTLDRGLDEFNEVVRVTIGFFVRKSQQLEKKGYKLTDHLDSSGTKIWELKTPFGQTIRILPGNFDLAQSQALEKAFLPEDLPFIKGKYAFRLYDTFGFPLDLTVLMANERGLKVDVDGFNQLMEQQRERAREAGRTVSVFVHDTLKVSDKAGAEVIPYIPEGTKPSQFVGYDKLEENTEVLLFEPRANVGYVILAKTPFYVESGGQVDDTGIIQVPMRDIRVIDMTKKDDHLLHVVEGPTDVALTQHQQVRAIVDKPRRFAIMKNHTATHLVHEALRRVLGSHVHQQGSLVAPDRLRFDFPHFGKITSEELRAIEEMVNERIQDAVEIYTETFPIEKARKIPNVKMFFGAKYGEVVRVVFVDERFSVEFCGGTHVKNTQEMGLFKIISESSIASGVRRIEAVTGDGVAQYIEERLQKIGKLDEQLAQLIEEKESLEKELTKFKQIQPTARPSLGTISLDSKHPNVEALDKVEETLRQREEFLEQVSGETQRLKKDLGKHRVQEAGYRIDSLISSASAVNGFRVVSARIDAGNMEELKSLGDSLRTKLGSGVGVLAAVVEDKVAFVCVVTDDLIEKKNLEAGKIISELAKRVSGGGGGRPNLATAGGKDVQNLDAALENTVSVVKSFLKR